MIAPDRERIESHGIVHPTKEVGAKEPRPDDAVGEPRLRVLDRSDELVARFGAEGRSDAVVAKLDQPLLVGNRKKHVSNSLMKKPRTLADVQGSSSAPGRRTGQQIRIRERNMLRI